MRKNVFSLLVLMFIYISANSQILQNYPEIIGRGSYRSFHLSDSTNFYVANFLAIEKWNTEEKKMWEFNPPILIFGLDIDQLQNLYIVGPLRAEMENITGQKLEFAPNRNVYSIARYNGNRQLNWIKSLEIGYRIPMAFSNGEISTIKTDKIGNVFIEGYYHDSLVLVEPTHRMLLAKGVGPIHFLMKFNKQGDFLWINVFNGSSTLSGLQLQVNSEGEAVLAGSFSGGNVFLNNNLTNTFLANNTNFNDVFISKFDAGGKLLEAYKSEFEGDAYFNASLLDAHDNLYLTGKFYLDSSSTNPSFKVGHKGKFEFLIAEDGDQFVAKYGYDLKLVKTIQFKPDWGIANGSIHNYKMQFDSAENIYLAATFVNRVDVLPGNNFATVSTKPPFHKDILISKFSNSLNHEWSTTFGGHFNEKLAVFGVGRDLYINFYNYNKANFYKPYDPVILNQGNYLAKLNFIDCQIKSDSINVTSCNFYQAPSGLNYWFQTGNYTDTLSTKSHCDSVIYIHVEITPIKDSIYQKNDTLFAQELNGDTYQWNECNIASTPIRGANNKTFIPQYNGYYSLTIRKNNCITTTACRSYFKQSTPKTEDFNRKFVISPNPAKDEVQIFLPKVQQFTSYLSVHLFTLHGKEVYKREFFPSENNTISFNTSFLANGTYFLKLGFHNNFHVEKLTIID